MAQSTPFMTLRPDPEDESQANVETLSMRSTSRNPSSSCGVSKQKPTCTDKFQLSVWRTFVIMSGLPLALACIVVLATVAEYASVGYILKRTCYPNGMWKEANGATWRIMDSSYFFTPDLSFGSMTFTQVKVIDITWDLLIGRGGQMLLAWVNYRVFNEWLLYHMEMHLTSYKMYTAVAFQTTTMSTLGVLGKEFLAFGDKTWRRFFRWLAMFCMLISTLYVLVFPTLMAAMTGYITTYAAYVEDIDHNLIEWERVSPIKYIINDSHRIGNYSRPLTVTYNDQDLIDAIQNYTIRHRDDSIASTPFSVAYPYKDRVTDLAESFTFLANESSLYSLFVFNGSAIRLEPSLNITWFSIGTPAESVSPGLTHYCCSLSNDTQGDVYNTSYIHTYGSCQPSETYQWGFSYIFLFMVSIFNFVWSCVVAGMWFDTTRGTRMYRSGRRPGLLRSIMDISGAIREEIGEAECERLEEKELRVRLKDSGGALVVPKRELRVARTDTADGEMRRRGWRRKLTTGSTF